MNSFAIDVIPTFCASLVASPGRHAASVEFGP